MMSRINFGHYVLTILLMVLFITFLGCGHKAQEKAKPSESSKFIGQKLDSLSFSRKGISCSAQVVQETAGTQNGFYFRIFDSKDSVLFERKLMDEFYYVHVLEGLEQSTINGKQYLFFTLWEKQQGTAAGLSSNIGIYLYDILGDNWWKIVYAGMDVDERYSVAGTIVNSDDLPSNPFLAKFIFTKMYSDERFACLTEGPFKQYFSDWSSFKKERFCTVSDNNIVFEKVGLPIEELMGDWLLINRDPSDSNNFYLIGSDCQNTAPRSIGMTISEDGIRYFDHTMPFMYACRIESGKKIFHIKDYEISYEYTGMGGDSDSTMSPIAYRFHHLGYGNLMEPRYGSILRCVSDDCQFEYIVSAESYKQFPIKDGRCDQP